MRTKAVREILEMQRRELEYALNDVWSKFYERILARHGECPDGASCKIKPGVKHLQHGPMDVAIFEEEILWAVREWLKHETIVATKVSDLSDRST